MRPSPRRVRGRQEGTARSARGTAHDPEAQAFSSLLRKLNAYPKDDVRYTRPPRKRSRAWRRSRPRTPGVPPRAFRASHAQMTVVGDFDAEQIAERSNGRSAVEVTEAARADRPHVRKRRVASEKIETPDKKMAMVTFGVNLALSDQDPPIRRCTCRTTCSSQRQVAPARPPAPEGRVVLRSGLVPARPQPGP